MTKDTNARAFLTTEVRLHRDSSGRIRASHNAAAFERWAPYRDGFGEIAVVGRLDEATPSDQGELVEGPGVVVVPLPHYGGFRGLILAIPRLHRALRTIGSADSVFVGRIPEPLSVLLFLRARRVRARFLSVLVVDPVQIGTAVWPGRQGQIAGRLLAGLTRAILARSAGVVYVTRSWLQARYPVSRQVPVLARSNVALPPEAFSEGGPSPTGSATVGPFLVVSIGTMGAPTKGFDTMCRAIRTVVDRGLDVRLMVIGGGSDLARVREVVTEAGLDDRVQLIGHVDSAQKMRDYLDQADIYLTTSRAEGLSRAVLEAMARGLPVVSTRAGGVEEILEEVDLVDIDDAEGVAERILTLSESSQLRAERSARSLRVAEEMAALSDPRLLSSFLTRYFS